MLHENVWALCLEFSSCFGSCSIKVASFSIYRLPFFYYMLRKNSQVDIIFYIWHGHCSQSELPQQKSVYSRAYIMLEDTHFYCCRCLRHRMTMPDSSYERPASDNFSACKNGIAGIRKTNALFRVTRTKCNYGKNSWAKGEFLKWSICL